MDGSSASPQRQLKAHHQTMLGEYYVSDIEAALTSETLEELKGQVQLILTSPPFPLNRKKQYGNLKGDEYLEWIEGLAPKFEELLSSDGSLVVEIGNSWEPDRPVQSLLPIEALLKLAKSDQHNLRLCQQFVCYNPSRLPSPAEWVTVRRERVVDSYTNVWWFSKSDHPRADNRKVLRPYSNSMKSLLKRKQYNSGTRPSEHVIGEKTFLKDNGGSIAQNVFEIERIDEEQEVRLPNVFRFANTGSNDFFSRECKKRKIKPHPARMPIGLAGFFIEFLTEKNDLVFDPFAGSNTTGFCAELLQRRWRSVDAKKEYATQSKLRLKDPVLYSEPK